MTGCEYRLPDFSTWPHRKNLSRCTERFLDFSWIDSAPIGFEQSVVRPAKDHFWIANDREGCSRRNMRTLFWLVLSTPLPSLLRQQYDLIVILLWLSCELRHAAVISTFTV
jgi:hypothetical protein